MPAATPDRSKQRPRAHVVFRLVVVVLTLAVLVRAAYHVTLATEQLFRIARGLG